MRDDVIVVEGPPRKILRVIVMENDYTLAANIGGPNELTARTFDLDCPADLAAALEMKKEGYVSRWIAGVEVREK